MRKITIIVNGKKNFSRKIKRTIDLLHAEYEVAVFRTTRQQHAVELASDASKNTDLIIAAGGDGTLHEVVNGVCNSGGTPSICVYPFGNGNDFATAVGIGKDPDHYVRLIKESYIEKIDVGVVSNYEGQKYFINIASIGLGGFVAQKINDVSGPFKYPRMIIEGFLRMKKADVIIQGAGSDLKTKVMTAAFCNSSTFANGLIIQPDAKINDGSLHSCVIGDVTIWEYIRNLGNLRNGRKIDHPEAAYSSGEEFTVDVINGECHIETDGEYFGKCPASFTVEKQKLSFLLPNRS